MVQAGTSHTCLRGSLTWGAFEPWLLRGVGDAGPGIQHLPELWRHCKERWKWLSPSWLAPFWQSSLFPKDLLGAVLLILDGGVLNRPRGDAEVCAGLSRPEMRAN